jgi:hypothetical protein
MIRYSYNRQLTPPAPFVHVTLRCPSTGKEIANFPAQLDTAADRSVIPWTLVEEMGLAQLDILPIAGFGGHIESIPTFLVQLDIRQLQSHTVEVLGSRGEIFVLLGRDLLNHYNLVLDGPQLSLKMS